MTTLQEAPFVQLQSGHVAIFGYGSLCSIRSVERTLAKPYQGPYLTCAVRGWRRCWDIAEPNDRFYTQTSSGRLYPKSILYLNVRPAETGLLNGVLFVVDQEMLAGFDRREWVYDRVEIAPQLERVRVEGGPAYLYVGRPQHRLENVPTLEVAAIRTTYLGILQDAFAAHGPTFRAEYESSTDPLPEGLVIKDECAGS
jgi:hypothetical protein